MSSLFKEKTNLPTKYIEITNFDDIEKLLEESNRSRVLIFKHSTRCIISKSAWRQFLNAFLEGEQKEVLYYLDLIAHKDLSKEIARVFEVEHQSPQVIIIEKGKVITHASHEAIDYFECKLS